MLKIIWTTIAVLVVSLCWGQSSNIKSPEARESEEARILYKENRVKSIKVVRIEATERTADSVDGKVVEVKTLDSNGYLINSKKLIGEGREITVNQKFDSLGNLLMFKQFVGDKLFHESKFYYDADNILISRVTVGPSGKVDSVSQKGKVEFKEGKRITTNAEGAFAAKVIEEFDEEKRLYKSTTLGQNGQPIQIVEYELNEIGQIISKSSLKSVGGNVNRFVHIYNDSNLRKETKMYDSNNALVKTIKNEFDTNGLLIKRKDHDFTTGEINTEVFRYEFFD